MKSILFPVILLIFIISPLFSEALSFRGIPFGAPELLVHEELGPPEERRKLYHASGFPDLQLRYPNLEVAGYSASAVIELKDDSLEGAEYIIRFPAADIKKIQETFNDLLEKLNAIYGSATDSSIKEPLTFKTSLGLEVAAPYRSLWNINGDLLVIVLEELRPWTITLSYISRTRFEALEERRIVQTKKKGGL